MWDEVKQARWDMLCRFEQERPLTSEERVELDRLATELEQDEWVALQPALERMHLEREQLEQEHRQARAESAALAILMTWQEALLARARAQVAELLAEHKALKREYTRVTGKELVATAMR